MEEQRENLRNNGDITWIRWLCILCSFLGITVLITNSYAKDHHSSDDLYRMILKEDQAIKIDLPYTHIKRIIPAAFMVPDIQNEGKIVADSNTYLVLESNYYYTAVSIGLFGHSFEFDLADINGDDKQDLLLKYINQRQQIIQPFYFDLTRLIKHPQDFRSHSKGKVFFEDGHFYEIEYGFLPYKWEKEGHRITKVTYSLGEDGLFVETDRKEEFIVEEATDKGND